MRPPCPVRMLCHVRHGPRPHWGGLTVPWGSRTGKDRQAQAVSGGCRKVTDSKDEAPRADATERSPLLGAQSWRHWLKHRTQHTPRLWPELASPVMFWGLR